MLGIKNLAAKVYRKILPKKEGESWINDSGKGEVGLIDVGAVGSLPSPWYENTPFIDHLLKFEPRNEESKTENVTALSTALWKQDEVRQFYVLQGKGGSGSSLLPPNPEYVRENFDELSSRGPKDLAETWFERSKVVRTKRVQCRTLDSVLSSLPQTFHFLKLDVQGAELKILRGSDKFLEKSCLGLHLELFKYPLYKKIDLIDKVRQFLERKDFELCIKYPPHGTFNSQHDCVFLHKEKECKKKDVIRSIYGIPA